LLDSQLPGRGAHHSETHIATLHAVGHNNITWVICGLITATNDRRLRQGRMIVVFHAVGPFLQDFTCIEGKMVSAIKTTEVRDRCVLEQTIVKLLIENIVERLSRWLY
jgi:hypothetical protein